MSLIVVEGVDASGKSTLLENARTQIKGRYFIMMRHSCRPLSLSDALGFMRTIDFASFHAGQTVVCDRHPLISEPIYGPIIREGHLFQSHKHLHLEDYRLDDLRNSVSRVIYCRPPIPIIHEHIDRNPQLEWVRERIDLLISAYDDTMLRLQDRGISVVWYDWTSYIGTLNNLFFDHPGQHA